MENKAQEIMKNYKKGIAKIDKKYEVKEVEKEKEVKRPKTILTYDLDEKIKYEEQLIAKLEWEGKDNGKRTNASKSTHAEITNEDLIKRANERLEKAKKDKKALEEKNLKNEETYRKALEERENRYKKALEERENKIQKMKALKRSTVILDSGREVTLEEKDKMDKMDLKDKAIRELTKESNNISEQLLIKSQELKAKKDEQYEFRPEYEKDENGNNILLNGDVIKKINEDINRLVKEMTDLNKMQEECNGYLEELKNPKLTKEEIAFSKAWYSAKRDEEGFEEDIVVEDNETDNSDVQPETSDGDKKGVEPQDHTTGNKEDPKPEDNTKGNQVEPNHKDGTHENKGDSKPENTTPTNEINKSKITKTLVDKDAGKVIFYMDNGTKKEYAIEEFLNEDNKSNIFKENNIMQICLDIVKDASEAKVLMEKIDPITIAALGYNGDKDGIKKYIESEYNGKKLNSKNNGGNTPPSNENDNTKPNNNGAGTRKDDPNGTGNGKGDDKGEGTKDNPEGTKTEGKNSKITSIHINTRTCKVEFYMGDKKLEFDKDGKKIDYQLISKCLTKECIDEVCEKDKEKGIDEINLSRICHQITGGRRFKTKFLISKVNPIILATLRINGDEDKIKEYIESIYYKRPMNNLGIDLQYDTRKNDKEEIHQKTEMIIKHCPELKEKIKNRRVQRMLDISAIRRYMMETSKEGLRDYINEIFDNKISIRDKMEIKRYAKAEEKVLGAEVLKDKKILGLLPARKKKLKNAPKTFESKSSRNESINEKRTNWAERVKPKTTEQTNEGKYVNLGYVHKEEDEERFL